ncbi:MAG: transporter [Rhizobiales bacterium]|nr:transporter [Hyphomicrobiales bacterium]
MARNFGLTVLGLFALTVMISPQARAAEGALGFYLLGSKTMMAGYLPGPGVYGGLWNYGYSGSGNIDFESGGVTVSGNIDADAYIAMPSLLWVLDADALGGHVAFSATTPYGGKSLKADALLTGPRGGVLATNYGSDNWAFGDPVLGAAWGGHSGKLFYSLGALLNVPVGPWEKGNPINISFNRWAFDTTAAITYLDPATGLELSGAAGLTFNGENPETNYETGTEFHFEWATMLHASHTFSVGFTGYAYKQITGDSGSGAVLGGFEGEVYAIGPALSYTFAIGTIPIVTNLSYLREFGAKNRLEGDVGFVNLAIPLGGQTPH